jgi:hypothetical protein
MLGDFVVEKASHYLSSRSERYMTQATAQASVTSQTIAVEHIRISSRRPFAEVRRICPEIRQDSGRTGTGDEARHIHHL